MNAPASLVAITRAVSPGIARCELVHLDRQPIDVDLARAQHGRYEQALAALGCEVHRLPAEPDLPDSVFVEDAAVVLDELAIITRPGAESRRPETASIAQALGPYRRLAAIQAPGTLDGGDVLRVGRDIFIGQSSRSNAAAIGQMQAIAGPLGYRVHGVPVGGCLHLKSAVTEVADRVLLINPDWVNAAAVPALSEMERIQVDPSEPYAANALRVGQTAIYPNAFPGTLRRLQARGIAVSLVDVSELAKAEGAVTCCSLIFAVRS